MYYGAILETTYSEIIVLMVTRSRQTKDRNPTIIRKLNFKRARTDHFYVRIPILKFKSVEIILVLQAGFHKILFKMNLSIVFVITVVKSNSG